MNRQRPPILICYDGSPGAARGAARAISAAGTLMAGSPAIVLYAWSGAAAEHARIPAGGVEAVRREMREEVRCAARREAAAVAAEGAKLARDAVLEARPLAVESGHGPADAIIQAAAKESAAAVVIGRTSRTRLSRLLPGSVPRRVIGHSLAPVVLA